MAKVKGITDQQNQLTTYLFWCPGCGEPHPYRVARSAGEPPEVPVWEFNGDVDHPTFRPSLLVDRGTAKQCHLHVTEGVLEYCADSHHALAGQRVECPDWDDARW